MKLFIFIFALSTAPSSFAEDLNCPRENWKQIGKITEAVQKFEILLATLGKSKDPNKDLNEFIKQNGLPITLSASAESEKKPEQLPAARLEGESPSGTVIALFLKKMRAPKGTSLDSAVEVTDIEGKKKLLSWQVPFEFSGPGSMDGDELYFKYTLSAICTETSFPVVFGVRPDGTYRVVDDKTPVEMKVMGKECTAAKHIFKKSSYGTCSEVTDLKTKKKRIVVWEEPMT